MASYRNAVAVFVAILVHSGASYQFVQQAAKEKVIDKSEISTFVPGNGSFLTYTYQLSVWNASELQYVCRARRYDFTVYYRMVYLRMCNTTDQHEVTSEGSSLATESRFDDFCSLLKSGNEKAKNLAKKYKIYGSGIESDERSLALKACGFIHDFYNGKSNTTQPPDYTEWLIHSVPFNLPVACGFTRSKFDSSSPSCYDCLATSHIASLYVTYFIDSCILMLILLSNVVILVVTWKTKILHTAHGIFRSSLACADLMMAIVMAGSMHTTRTIYFGRHKFLAEGQVPSQLDYHSQAYIDTFGSLTVLSLTASILTLVCTSIDRFIAISRPLKYKLCSSGFKKISLALMLLVWMSSFVLAVYPAIDGRIGYQLTALGVIIALRVYMVYIGVMATSLTATWLVNIGIFVLVKRRMSQSNRLTAPSRLSLSSKATNGIHNPNNMCDVEVISERRIHNCNNNSRVSRSSSDDASKLAMSITKSSAVETALAKTVRLVVGGLTLALLPSIAVMAAGTSLALEPRSSRFNPQAKAAWNSFAYLASRTLFANSFFNCLIYSYRNKAFRTASKSFLSGQTFRRNSASQLKTQTVKSVKR